MQIVKTIKDYLRALESGNDEDMIKLFAKDAVVFSPLYGEMKAINFYREVFKDTLRSKITLLNILRSRNPFIAAGHFRYEWVLKDGTPTYFECVDIFQFAQDGKIK